MDVLKPLTLEQTMRYALRDSRFQETIRRAVNLLTNKHLARYEAGFVSLVMPGFTTIGNPHSTLNCIRMQHIGDQLDIDDPFDTLEYWNRIGNDAFSKYIHFYKHDTKTEHDEIGTLLHFIVRNNEFHTLPPSSPHIDHGGCHHFSMYDFAMLNANKRHHTNATLAVAYIDNDTLANLALIQQHTTGTNRLETHLDAMADVWGQEPCAEYSVERSILDITTGELYFDNDLFGDRHA